MTIGILVISVLAGHLGFAAALWFGAALPAALGWYAVSGVAGVALLVLRAVLPVAGGDCPARNQGQPRRAVRAGTAALPESANHEPVNPGHCFR